MRMWADYRLRLAETREDREAACRLRFKVFNIELGEGLESSYETGLDTDRFDAVCEHCWWKTKASRRVVGTYRMQSGETAARNLGYYSEQEFNLAPYEPLRAGDSGTWPRLDRPRASHSRGADVVVEGDRAVCYRHGASLLARLLFFELQRPGGGLADVSPA